MQIHFTCQWKGGAYVSGGGAAVYIVIVGAGEVGSNIAESLAKSHEVAVVDTDHDRGEAL